VYHQERAKQDNESASSKSAIKCTGTGDAKKKQKSERNFQLMMTSTINIGVKIKGGGTLVVAKLQAFKRKTKVFFIKIGPTNPTDKEYRGLKKQQGLQN
jgi:hypothetical protein